MISLVEVVAVSVVDVLLVFDHFSVEEEGWGDEEIWSAIGERDAGRTWDIEVEVGGEWWSVSDINPWKFSAWGDEMRDESQVRKIGELEKE